MLTIENLQKSYGPQTLFKNVGFAISEKARVGVVGPNGAGKSTFFRMLMGDEHPDDGEIRMPKNYRLSLLRQEWLPKEGDNVLEATLREYTEWYRSREELKRLEVALQKDTGLLVRYQKVEAEFSALGGFYVEQTAKELLSGLGFEAKQFGDSASTLSGGWRMRCHLAGLLLQSADLLLLDEPTNHLDVESVAWFEEFLKTYEKSIMIISHDRRLIDRIANQILEFAPPQMTLWPGNLRKFEEQKATRMQLLEAEIANKQKEVDRLQDFARRFRAKATKARQAQNRLKTSAKYEDDITKLMESMPVVSKRPARFKLELRRRLPRQVISFQDCKFGYQTERVLFSLNKCVVEAGKKIGIIGVNGVGKSTFLRCCAGFLPLLSGEMQKHEQITVGWFAQHRLEELPEAMNALDYLNEKSADNSITTVRAVAASLGLTANDLDKDIAVLSGGEKARVSLARILLSRPGLLLLDEPTNHLDMEACDALIRGLSDYQGTILAVSHNREFLDELVDYILEIKPGEAILHHGNYNDWLARHEYTSNSSPVANESISEKKSKRKTAEQKRLEAESRQRRYQQQKESKDRLITIESELSTLQAEKKELDELLCDPETPKNPEFGNWIKKHGQLSSRLETLEQEWLELSTALEN